MQQTDILSFSSTASRAGGRQAPRRGKRRGKNGCRRALLWGAAVALGLLLALQRIGLPGGTAASSQAATQPLVDGPAEWPAQDVVQLPVETILQDPELPNGCEITSAAILLGYLGWEADKVVLAQRYLPCHEPYDQTDPEQAYMGDPATGHGYYCMSGPIVQALDAWLADAGANGLRAADLSGAGEEELCACLQEGRPVIVWITRGFGPPAYHTSFTLPDGRRPYSNLHCLVLTGYDQTQFTVADPLGEYQIVDRQAFLDSYTAMGCRAVTVVPAGEAPGA